MAILKRQISRKLMSDHMSNVSEVLDISDEMLDMGWKCWILFVRSTVGVYIKLWQTILLLASCDPMNDS